MMIKARFRIGPALLVVAVLIAGLVTPGQGAAQGQTSLRIGYLGVLDSETADGAQLAIDQINSGGGITGPDGTVYTLKLVALANPPTQDTFAADVADLVSKSPTAILGPDESLLFTPDNIQTLSATQLPIFTPSTLNALTDTDTSNTIFRTRAPERVYSTALATYLTQDLGFQSIALVQTDVEATEALVDFETVMTNAGLTPADRIQLPGGSPLVDEAQRLLALGPEVVVMWGPFADAENLLRQLREGGWTGRFAYRYAEEAARAGVFSDVLGEGIIGVTSWSYGYGGRASRIFLRDYVTGVGEVPGSLSAAAYDTLWFLRGAITRQGADPAALLADLLNAPPMAIVQGMLRPADFVNGDLTRVAMVYELGPRGGPVVVAAYDDTQPLPLEDATEVVQAVPTATPGLPTDTPAPTATFEGTWAVVKANVLNVRNGPGFNFDKIGEVSAGEALRVLSAIPDYSWLVVDFQGGVGWVKTEYVDITGDLGIVEVVQPPASPTPAATLTPTLPPDPDLVIDAVALNPAQPVPGQVFTALVTIRNAGGGAAGRFAVAATFEPGAVYTATFVEGLAGGQSTQTQLTATLTGTGAYTVAVLADLNKEIAELDENNNTYNVTYRADYPAYTEQSGVQVDSGVNRDLYGGSPEFVWNGNIITMQNGAAVGVLGGLTYENVHYDLLTPSVINNTGSLDTSYVNAGVVLGMYTAEGERAVVRIDNRQGTTIWITYRVYNDMR